MLGDLLDDFALDTVHLHLFELFALPLQIARPGQLPDLHQLQLLRILPVIHHMLVCRNTPACNPNVESDQVHHEEHNHNVDKEEAPD